MADTHRATIVDTAHCRCCKGPLSTRIRIRSDIPVRWRCQGQTRRTADEAVTCVVMYAPPRTANDAAQ